MSFPTTTLRMLLRTVCRLPLDHRAVGYLRRHAKYAFRQPLTPANLAALKPHQQILSRALALNDLALESLIEIAYKKGAMTDNFRDRPGWLKRFTAIRPERPHTEDLVVRWPRVELAEKHNRSPAYLEAYREANTSQRRKFNSLYASSFRNVGGTSLMEELELPSDDSSPTATRIALIAESPALAPSAPATPLLSLPQIEALYRKLGAKAALGGKRKALHPFAVEIPPHPMGRPLANVRIKNLTVKKIASIQGFFNKEVANLSLANLRALEALVREPHNYKQFNLDRLAPTVSRERVLRKLKNRYTSFLRGQYAFADGASGTAKTDEPVLAEVFLQGIDAAP